MSAARTRRVLARASRVRGFSMVEALVALVVLGVGMLGIASLHVVTVRTSGSAISRMHAVNLASDIGDRIRANRNAGTAYEFDGEPAEGEEAPASCVGSERTCSPAEMAAHDLAEWNAQISAMLPGEPTGSIDVDTTTNPTTYTITVTWIEAGDTEQNRQSYAMSMQI